MAGFKLPDARILRQQLHLLDGDLVQLAQSVRLGHFLLDDEGVQVLEVRETHELRHIRVIADIALLAGMTAGLVHVEDSYLRPR